MLPDWISSLATRYKKMHKSSTNGPQSERLMEEAQKQDDVPDFGATFLASLYSNRAWDDTTGGRASKTKKIKEQKAKDCLTQFFSPVYSLGTEPIRPSESKQLPLKVEELYAKKEIPFEWTGEYMDLDLEKKVASYNSIPSGMKITPHKDGINAEGHIRVNMAFIRPIEVVQRVVPSPVQNTEDMGKSKDKPTPTVKITETILPQNTTEVIDIDSKTTARQMIVRVFKNLRMVNVPRDYALYEYEPQIDETAGKLTRKWTQIADDACPLKVVLSWPIPHSGRALVLQEKDNRDVQENTDEIEMQDIYSKVTGLKKNQVDVKIEEKSRTGLFETMLSKEAPSNKDESAEFLIRLKVVVALFMIVAFLTLLSLPFVAIYNKVYPPEQPASFAGQFLQNKCYGLLKKVLQEMEK